jgi:hypothetical protein
MDEVQKSSNSENRWAQTACSPPPQKYELFGVGVSGPPLKVWKSLRMYRTCLWEFLVAWPQVLLPLSPIVLAFMTAILPVVVRV